MGTALTVAASLGGNQPRDLGDVNSNGSLEWGRVLRGRRSDRHVAFRLILR
jgi:hypothetical protein